MLGFHYDAGVFKHPWTTSLFSIFWNPVFIHISKAELCSKASMLIVMLLLIDLNTARQVFHVNHHRLKTGFTGLKSLRLKAWVGAIVVHQHRDLYHQSAVLNFNCCCVGSFWSCLPGNFFLFFSGIITTLKESRKWEMHWWHRRSVGT